MCTNVSFSAPHSLYYGNFTLPLLCNKYYRLAYPARNPSSTLQCFLSSLFISVLEMSISRPLQKYLASLIFFMDFLLHLFAIASFSPIFYLQFISAQGWSQVGFRSFCLILDLFLASPSAAPFCVMPLCPGVHTVDSRSFSDSTASFSN